MTDQNTELERSLAVRLKEVEEELRMLRRRLSERPAERPVQFSDLLGLWRGKSNFSYEEIKEAEIRLEDEQ